MEWAGNVANDKGGGCVAMENGCCDVIVSPAFRVVCGIEQRNIAVTRMAIRSRWLWCHMQLVES